MSTQSSGTGCCPKFDPKQWDEKIFDWKEKKFIKGNVITLFNIPVNFGSVIKRMTQKVQSAKAEMPNWMCLSDHKSKWSMDLYLEVDKKIPDGENMTISGTFLTKVYEGPYKETGKWCKDFTNLVKNQKHELKKMYMWYTTCPKCAKAYGKNYVVIVGQV